MHDNIIFKSSKEKNRKEVITKMKSGVNYKDVKKIIDEHDKDFKIKVKSEDKGHVLLGKIMSIFNKRYMTGYYTQIGSTLWVPDEREKNDMMSSDISMKNLQILFHELEHVKQKNKDGKIKFSIKYMFPQIISLFCLAIILVILSCMGILSILGFSMLGYFTTSLVAFLIIGVMPLVPSMMEAKSRLMYEVEAYKVSMLVYYYFGFRHSALSYTTFVPSLMTRSDYYWATDTKNFKKIEAELINFYAKLVERKDVGYKLPTQFEEIWEQLDEITQQET